MSESVEIPLFTAHLNDLMHKKKITLQSQTEIHVHVGNIITQIKTTCITLAEQWWSFWQNRNIHVHTLRDIDTILSLITGYL